MRKFIIVFLAVASAAFAENAPPTNFSGSWKLNLQKSSLPKNSKIRSEVLVIKHSPPMIEFQVNVNDERAIHTYQTDGKERPLGRVQDGGAISGKAYWKKNVLIIETKAEIGDMGYELVHTKTQWSLSDDGQTLTEKEDDPKSASVFEKQE